jgi:hypothetical protein
MELAVRGRVAPVVGFEPPAADSVQKPSQVTAAGLLERGVQVSIVLAQCVWVGVRGQDVPDRGGSAGEAPQRAALTGIWCGHATSQLITVGSA